MLRMPVLGDTFFSVIRSLVENGNFRNNCPKLINQCSTKWSDILIIFFYRAQKIYLF